MHEKIDMEKCNKFSLLIMVSRTVHLPKEPKKEKKMMKKKLPSLRPSRNISISQGYVWELISRILIQGMILNVLFMHVFVYRNLYVLKVLSFYFLLFFFYIFFQHFIEKEKDVRNFLYFYNKSVFSFFFNIIQ